MAIVKKDKNATTSDVGKAVDDYLNSVRHSADIRGDGCFLPLLHRSEASNQFSVLAHPIALDDDWIFPERLLAVMSRLAVDQYWEDVASFNIQGYDYLLLECRYQSSWRLGFFDTDPMKGEVFKSFFFIRAEPIPWSRQLGYPAMLQVSKVGSDIDMRMSGVAKLVYCWIVHNKKVALLSDHFQYKGARRLWARLSRLDDVRIDLVDVSPKRKVVKAEGIRFTHDPNNEDFDPKLWSKALDVKKENLLFVLREAKPGEV